MFQIQTKFNGDTVLVSAHILPPEPEVGLAGYSYEDVEITDEENNPVEATPEEKEQLGWWVVEEYLRGGR